MIWSTLNFKWCCKQIGRTLRNTRMFWFLSKNLKQYEWIETLTVTSLKPCLFCWQSNQPSRQKTTRCQERLWWHSLCFWLFFGFWYIHHVDLQSLLLSVLKSVHQSTVVDCNSMFAANLPWIASNNHESWVSYSDLTSSQLHLTASQNWFCFIFKIQQLLCTTPEKPGKKGPARD